MATPASDNAIAGRRGLFGSAAVIASGHAAGYVLTVAAAPVLSRLYSPESFGVLAVFLALATVTSTIGTLRFDQAIVLPRRHATAVSLATLACFSALAIFVALLIAATVNGRISIRTSGWPVPEGCLLLLAAAVSTTAVYQITCAWMVRLHQFGLLAQARIVYIAIGLAVQIAIPLWLIAGPVGLISGQIAGFGVAGIVGAWKLRRVLEQTCRGRSTRLGRIASQYRNYPLYEVWAALMSTLGLFAPAVLLAVLYGADVAGYFALAHRMLATPLTMFSNSMSRVYYAEAARIGRRNRLALRALFLLTLRRALLLTAPPVILAAIAAPLVFATIFGPEWHDAGIYLSLIAPMVLSFVLAFVLGTTLDVVGRQRRKMTREIICLALIAVGIALPRLLSWSAVSAVATMSVLGTAGYLLAVAITWSAVAEPRPKHPVRLPLLVESRAA